MEMPKWTKRILKYAQSENLLKAPFTIYFDLECLLKKQQSCQKNPEKSYKKKKAAREPSGRAMFTKCFFGKK